MIPQIELTAEEASVLKSAAQYALADMIRRGYHLHTAGGDCPIERVITKIRDHFDLSIWESYTRKV